MKKAVLMVRVSTDEQADRGYSLDVQEEQLRKYCEIKSIEIIRVYREDHSAKNFDRPEFKQFLQFAKSNHRNIDYLLFVSWDRFSRNAPDAYDMIRRLKKWDIEPQAIQQPIDFSIPQNKVMLSIYLTLPEVDNDIRADKTISGMRGANKVGRITGVAPIGYKNQRDEFNKPIIVPTENSHHISWAFQEASKNERPLNDIRKELNERGVKVSRSSFSRMMRNPIYMGKIRVRAYKDEPEQIVEGLHVALVSEEVFNTVQLVLSGRYKRKQKTLKKYKDRIELPLRGLLNCTKCGNHITGSASRSKTGDRYWYYHCDHCKRERYRADKVNRDIEGLLGAMQISTEGEELFNAIMEQELSGSHEQKAAKRSNLKQELTKLEQRKENLQNAFLDGNIDVSDYSDLKRRLDNRIFEVRSQLDDLKETNRSFKQAIKRAITVLPNLLKWYRNQGVEGKKRLLSSVFPEKLTFDGKRTRTPRINSLIALILSYDRLFRGNKKGTNEYQLRLSHLVTPQGLEPRSAA